MNPEETWSELAREAAIDVKGLAKIQERMPRLRVDVTLADARIGLAFGKSTLVIALDQTSSSSDPRRAMVSSASSSGALPAKKRSLVPSTRISRPSTSEV